MSKTIFLTVLALVFTIGFVSLNYASPEGNGRKGKYVFRKNCRTCHVEDGSAVELSPISKTQADWDAAFAEGAFEALACKDEWSKQSDKDLLDIYTYMYDHAFDSPSPLKCE